MLVTPNGKPDTDGNGTRLTPARRYEVLGIEADMYRLLTDENDTSRPNSPYLFSPDCFDIVDGREPAFWVNEVGEDGERYCYPAAWSAPGFFEDYFDGVASSKDLFMKVLEELYPATAKERFGKL